MAAYVQVLILVHNLIVQMKLPHATTTIFRPMLCRYTVLQTSVAPQLLHVGTVTTLDFYVLHRLISKTFEMCICKHVEHRPIALFVQTYCLAV